MITPTITRNVAGKVIIHLPQANNNRSFLLNNVDLGAYYHSRNSSWYVDGSKFEQAVTACLARYKEVTVVTQDSADDEPSTIVMRSTT